MGLVHEAPQRVRAVIGGQEVQHQHVGRMILHQAQRIAQLRIDQIVQVGDEFVFVARFVLHVGRQAILAQFGFIGLEQIGRIDGLALIG